jgi:hypothetical protein
VKEHARSPNHHSLVKLSGLEFKVSRISNLDGGTKPPDEGGRPPGGPIRRLDRVRQLILFIGTRHPV